MGIGHDRIRRRGLQALSCAALVSALAPRAARGAVDVGSKNLHVLRPKIERLPSIRLKDMNGGTQRLDQALDSSEPLLLSFIFTTCSTSCSVLSAIMADVQRRFAEQHRRLKLASITIDPANDTPEQLRRYARKFDASAAWGYYTGDFDDLLEVQKHFDVYRGSKVSHPPVLMLRRHGKAPWVRAEGFPTPGEVVALIDALPA